jgi:Na+/H+ antiporter NhaD/arsenite permease-like protein
LDTLVLVVFILVYLGMILGEWPGLAVDRTGIALLGAIVLLTAGRLQTSELATAVDMPTLALLLGLMVLSAQFRLSGLYSWVVRYITNLGGSPAWLLALVIAASGVLSAVLANDIVCLAMSPVLVECCVHRRLDPKPFLLGLACASNVGSAATLIGNPQNMLIGQVLQLSFAGYLRDALVPAVLGLAVTWAVICWASRGRWEGASRELHVASPPFNRWQTTKGLMVTAAIMLLFLASSWPREIIALGAAGVLLCSRRMHSRGMLGLVDWQLLVLFFGLFVVNHVMQTTGNLDWLMVHVRSCGVEVEDPRWLFGLSVVLSNLVSNVPAVMLLLPHAVHPLAGPVLALSSTMAGNLLVVGSIANMIVIDQAQRLGVKISWTEHARIGIPVTLLTLAITALWLVL